MIEFAIIYDLGIVCKGTITEKLLQGIKQLRPLRTERLLNFSSLHTSHFMQLARKHS